MQRKIASEYEQEEKNQNATMQQCNKERKGKEQGTRNKEQGKQEHHQKQRKQKQKETKQSDK